MLSSYKSRSVFLLLAVSLIGASTLSAHQTAKDVYEYDLSKGFDRVDFLRGGSVEPWLEDLEVESRPQPASGLGGRRVFLAPGHGRTYNESSNWWGWQRDSVDGGEVEDLITARITNRWLAHYFENAGANVVISRERDEQLNELHLDDADDVDTEKVGTWTTVSNAVSGPYEGSAHRAAADSGATFTWYADIPEVDRYGLRFWFPDEPDAASDATLIIHTAAGDVRATVNQLRNTSRWLWIDSFVFPEGRVPIATLVADSDQEGHFVYADGIRLGGGMGSFDGGSGVSGLPRWQEYCKSWAIKYGAPSTVWDQFVTASDFGIRRNMAFWAEADIYIEPHSNASGGTSPGTQTGTMTYWSRSTNDAMREQFRTLHDNMIQALKDRWMPTWRDAGFLNDDVDGTALPSHLIEMAFHDRTSPDLEGLLDPDFRSILARSMYEGAVAIARGDDEGVFLPEPPEAPAVRNLGDGSIEISWQPPSYGPEVDAYRLYRSTDGLAFDLGESFPGDETTIVLEGYTPGEEVYFQLRALNDGGRSFPTETLGVRIGNGDPLLVVNGFDRLDRYVQEPNNPRRFIIEHLRAFAGADDTIAVDFASNEALLTSSISLNDYTLVDWILGLEVGSDETFSIDEQALVSNYLSQGGRLFLSGSNVAQDLVTEGTDDDKSFARNVLNVGASGARTDVQSANGMDGDFFAGLSLNLGSDPYEVKVSDVYTIGLLGRPVMNWVGGATAAVAYGSGPGKSIVSALPLEAVSGEASRSEYASAVLSFLRAPVEEDVTAPSISNVVIAPISQTFADVKWRTDEVATNVIDWGVAGGALDQQIIVPGEGKTHSARIDGLSLLTDYELRITATDSFSNTTVGDVIPFTTAGVDNTPPVISNVRVLSATDRDAHVYFTTDELAQSNLVSTAPAGGTIERGNDGFVRAHYLVIRNLPANSNIDVTLSAADSQNNVATETLSINTTPPVTPLIVDNLDPGFSLLSGTWSTGTFGSPFGGDYRFSSINSSGATAEAQWETTITVGGNYRVSCIFISGGNRTAAAGYTIMSPNGELLRPINQQSGGNVWQVMEENVSLPAGYTAVVKLNNFSTSSGVVMADAIQWEFQGLGSVNELEVQDSFWIVF